MDSTHRYLLVLACSQRKHSDLGLLPAMQRYDGVTFRVLRKAKREGYWPSDLDVLILSARFGLIDASFPIPSYEQRMTPERADQLEPQVTHTLQKYSAQNKYREVYIDVGKDYLPAITDLDQTFNKSSVVYAEGRIGERLSQLKNWLLKINDKN